MLRSAFYMRCESQSVAWWYYKECISGFQVYTFEAQLHFSKMCGKTLSPDVLIITISEKNFSFWLRGARGEASKIILQGKQGERKREKQSLIKILISILNNTSRQSSFQILLTAHLLSREKMIKAHDKWLQKQFLLQYRKSNLNHKKPWNWIKSFRTLPMWICCMRRWHESEKSLHLFAMKCAENDETKRNKCLWNISVDCRAYE